MNDETRSDTYQTDGNSQGNTQIRKGSQALMSGILIGTLGGLIGLGGAEFRLPVLVGLFRLSSLHAVILNKAMSLVVVAAALIFRAKTIPIDTLIPHWMIIANLLAGSLAGAWWAAGHTLTMPREKLDQLIMFLLGGLAILMLSEAGFGLHGNSQPLFEKTPLLFLSGWLAGIGIGMVAALLGVAGGELLIPTIVLLYGVDLKLAGSLSLAVSLPTMIVGFIRYSRANAFAIIWQEQTLFIWMVIGSLLGVALGGMLLDVVTTRILAGLLGAILLVSAIKTFQHKN